MKRSLALLFLVVCLASCLYAQQSFSTDVRILRFPAPDRWGLIVRPGTLTFYDGARKMTMFTRLIYNEDQYRLDVSYDSIEMANFEVTTHVHGFINGLLALGASGVIANDLLANKSVSSCWLFLSYKESSGKSSILLELPEDDSAQVIAKATKVLGVKVTVVSPEKGSKIELNDLKDLGSKQVVRIDKKNHPLPEVKPDKATIVVVCPEYHSGLLPRRVQFKLHANDHVVAVNTIGTYSIAYLEPGKYRLVSQRDDANGFEMELEAGHKYYFLQNVLQKGVVPNESVLSQNSPELVMYLLHGAQFSDWTLKN